MMFIDYSVAKDCINPNSYGVICLKCNACGRFNKEKQKESALELYRENLKKVSKERQKLLKQIESINEEIDFIINKIGLISK